jgi:hypothetical protein
MDIIDEIKNAENEMDLEVIAFNAIAQAKEYSQENNEPRDTIGSIIDFNGHPKIVTSENDRQDDCMICNCYVGYIPLGMRIVYGTFVNTKNKAYSNNGYYYYLDDESYVKEFFKYLHDHETEDDYDIIVLLNDFMAEYFDKSVDWITRENLHQLFWRPNGRFYPPCKEHSIQDFYGNGAAQCSEYATFAQNVLSALGFRILYLMDTQHAYNIIICDDKPYVLDYSQGIEVVDACFNHKAVHPFFGEIPNATEETISDFIDEGMSLELNDYYLQEINGTLYQHKIREIRKYGIAGIPTKGDVGLSKHK